MFWYLLSEPNQIKLKSNKEQSKQEQYQFLIESDNTPLVELSPQFCIGVRGSVKIDVHVLSNISQWDKSAKKLSEKLICLADSGHKEKRTRSISFPSQNSRVLLLDHLDIGII